MAGTGGGPAASPCPAACATACRLCLGPSGSPGVRQALPLVLRRALFIGGVAAQVGVSPTLQRASDPVHGRHCLILSAAHGANLRSECSTTWIAYANFCPSSSIGVTSCLSAWTM